MYINILFLAIDGKKDRIAEQQLLIYVGNNKPEDRPNMINGSKDYLTVVENEGKQMNRY